MKRSLLTSSHYYNYDETYLPIESSYLRKHKFHFLIIKHWNFFQGRSCSKSWHSLNPLIGSSSWDLLLEWLKYKLGKNIVYDPLKICHQNLAPGIKWYPKYFEYFMQFRLSNLDCSKQILNDNVIVPTCWDVCRTFKSLCQNANRAFVSGLLQMHS
jgi:hypothetical protein